MRSKITFTFALDSSCKQLVGGVRLVHDLVEQFVRLCGQTTFHWRKFNPPSVCRVSGNKAGSMDLSLSGCGLGRAHTPHHSIREDAASWAERATHQKPTRELFHAHAVPEFVDDRVSAGELPATRVEYGHPNGPCTFNLVRLST